jgi:hypothetical protein
MSADWRQQEECEERRWTLERGLARMERDVERGSALQQILAAEKAERELNEQERKHGNHCER